MTLSRRLFLAIAPIGSLFARPSTAGAGAAPGSQAPAARSSPQPAQSFPSHDPTLVREMVGVAHGNVARVKELVASCPALAKASWDWGYGDWETALGAASHVGNREIAAALLAAGAPPTIFSAAMLGQLQVVQALVAASPGIQRTRGPHGIPLLDHARLGKADEVVKYLESLGDAEPRYTNESLSDADRGAIVGTYAYGPAADDRLTVAVNSRGSLMILRPGATERGLLHLGSRVFHPVGAEAVRIRFAAGDRATSLVVEDGPLVVAARRAT